MNLRHRWAAAASAGLMITALAACGSDSDDSAGGDFTGDPITVLTMAPTGTQTLNFDTAAVHEAYAKKVNANGGIGGRELKVITCNEKADPNAAAACAREAVEKKVAAVVGGFTSNGDQVFPVLEGAGIPYLGSLALTSSDLSSASSYPILSGPISFGGLGGIAAQTCDTTAVVIMDVPAAAAVPQFAGAALEKAGKRLADTVKVPPTTTDYSTVAKSIDGVECAIIGLPSAAVAPLVAAMEQLEVQTRLIAPAGAFDKPLLTKYAKSLEGSATVSSYPVYSDKLWDEAREVLGDDVDLSNSVIQNAWVSMLVLEKVAEGIDGPVDAETLTKALDASTAIDTGGLTQPLNFSQEFPMDGLKRSFNPVVVNLVVKDGDLVQQGDFVNLGAALAAG